jgi:hypothetical protein
MPECGALFTMPDVGVVGGEGGAEEHTTNSLM